MRISIHTCIEVYVSIYVYIFKHISIYLHIYIYVYVLYLCLYLCLFSMPDSLIEAPVHPLFGKARRDLSPLSRKPPAAQILKF